VRLVEQLVFGKLLRVRSQWVTTSDLKKQALELADHRCAAPRMSPQPSPIRRTYGRAARTDFSLSQGGAPERRAAQLEPTPAIRPDHTGIRSSASHRHSRLHPLASLIGCTCFIGGRFWILSAAESSAAARRSIKGWESVLLAPTPVTKVGLRADSAETRPQQPQTQVCARTSPQSASGLRCITSCVGRKRAPGAFCARTPGSFRRSN